MKPVEILFVEDNRCDKDQTRESMAFPRREGKCAGNPSLGLVPCGSAKFKMKK
jgi:hypothetical protein